MEIQFTKAEAAGNDLIIVDARITKIDILAEVARALCDRHFGVGADGLMIVQNSPALVPKVRMFNPDGTEDFCGNGLRCVAAWMLNRGEGNGNAVELLTPKGSHIARVVEWDGRGFLLDVDVLIPAFSPVEIPACVSEPRILQMPLDIGGRPVTISSVAVGTTHTVIFQDEDVDDETFFALSPLIENHAIFPERTSVLWCRVESPKRVSMRIWERGVGETQSCGTGACAVMAVGKTLEILGECVEIVTTGGSLSATWTGSGPIRLTGPVRLVYTGTYEL
jgi:diaminopimelate epimerase